MAALINKNPEFDKLVQKAKQGDEAAFGQVYDLYFPKVYRFVFYRVNHKEVAEDLTAETFIRVWNKLSEMQGPSSFSAWIYQIARNLVIDYYRSKKATVDLAELENVLEYEENILEKTNFGFDQQAFLAALKNLSSDQQLVIKLKFLEELENDEIAKMLDKTEGAIRVIQHRAVRELKEFFDKQNHDN